MSVGWSVKPIVNCIIIRGMSFDLGHSLSFISVRSFFFFSFLLGSQEISFHLKYILVDYARTNSKD